MRLIDADRLQKQFNEKSTNPNYRVNMHNIKSIITNAPTVEAIPKADYENRLKADMVAMLTELKNELTDISWNIDMYDDDLDFECCYLNDIDEVIQQKINSLKEAKDG
jgi:hypothetical protein